jgi:hypothetical protein
MPACSSEKIIMYRVKNNRFRPMMKTTAMMNQMPERLIKVYIYLYEDKLV